MFVKCFFLKMYILVDLNTNLLKNTIIIFVHHNEQSNGFFRKNAKANKGSQAINKNCVISTE